MSDGECLRIGHGGASALARGNTLRSFDAALQIGVDVIEFDVRTCAGELVLAHTAIYARCSQSMRGPRWSKPVPLDTALRHLAAPRFSGVELAVDLKATGCEAATLEAIRSAGLLARATFCSQVVPVLDQVRRLEPQARTAISVGGRAARLSRRWGDWRAQVLAGLATRRWDGLMAQHRLIEPSLVEAVRRRESRIFAWTVNERQRIEALRSLGVHGIATADPRLFA